MIIQFMSLSMLTLYVTRSNNYFFNLPKIGVLLQLLSVSTYLIRVRNLGHY